MSEATSIVDERGIRGKLNNSGTDIAKDLLVSHDTTLDQIILPAGAGNATFGVTLQIVKNTYYGDIQIRGKARVIAGAGGIAVGDRVMATTAGAAVVATTTKYVAGVCVLAAASGAVGEIELNGPGIGGKEP